MFSRLCNTNSTLIKRDQKTGHLGVGYGQLTRVPLLGEQRNDASPASNDAPVTNDGIGGASSPGIAVGRDENFVRTELGRTVKVDGVDRFVCAQSNDFLDSRPYGGLDHAGRSVDIGLDEFVRVVLGSGTCLRAAA